MPLENPAQEALRVLEEAERRKVTLRLLGGLAFFLRCPSAKRPDLARTYVDIDTIGRQKDSPRLRTLFTDLGYTARDRFNALQGYRRLIYDDPGNGRRVDVFLDVFEMCHTFDFSKRLELDRYTLSLSDLLITKLQIVEITPKDFKDLLALLIDHEVEFGDGAPIDARYIAKLCSADWGVYTTLTINLDKLVEQIRVLDTTETERTLVTDRIGRLRGAIEAVPKGWGWKARAAVGQKARWYELPEGI
jgi:hypothetical protein